MISFVGAPVKGPLDGQSVATDSAVDDNVVQFSMRLCIQERISGRGWVAARTAPSSVTFD